jgi:hypothetical protein
VSLPQAEERSRDGSHLQVQGADPALEQVQQSEDILEGGVVAFGHVGSGLQRRLSQSIRGVRESLSEDRRVDLPPTENLVGDTKRAGDVANRLTNRPAVVRRQRAIERSDGSARLLKSDLRPKGGLRGHSVAAAPGTQRGDGRSAKVEIGRPIGAVRREALRRRRPSRARVCSKVVGALREGAAAASGIAGPSPVRRGREQPSATTSRTRLDPRATLRSRMAQAGRASRGMSPGGLHSMRPVPTGPPAHSPIDLLHAVIRFAYDSVILVFVLSRVLGMAA